jgi:hypothetical protein
MLWLGHLLTTRAYFGKLELDDMLWAIAPDLPMALFLSPGGAFVDPNTPWHVIKNWSSYIWFYKFPHSLWFLILIQNSRARNIYAFHILMDLLSHTGQWSIEPFFPIGPAIHGIWDPVEWV